MAYTTNDLRTIFKIAPETIRNWTREFAHYLSITANPEVGRTRLYTEEDVKVLDLVAKMRTENKSYEDIHVALKVGERGSSPGLSPEEVRVITTGEMEKQLSLEIQVLRRQLAISEEKVKELDELKTRSVRLEAEKEAEKRRADELANQIKEMQKKIEEYLRELGKAYHQGYMDGLKHRPDQNDAS